MRLVVTGGGTGGHVYPALEVARLAASRGWEVEYLGSLRGQEGRVCALHGIAFRGFPSEPLYSLKTPRGWRAALNLMRARSMARSAMAKRRPDAVFSTGGYSGAPVMGAAKALGIPYVVHEQNSVPGRSNLMFARSASAIATTFHGAERHFEGCKVERTGLPVREDLRAIAEGRKEPCEARVLVVGGSQGSAAINAAALGTAQRMTCPDVHWLHQTGKAHFGALFHSIENLGLSGCYKMKPFLEGRDMGEAYAWASVVVGRSGASTLSEVAAFGLPSVLVPYPSAFGGHQMFNAREFEAMGAAKVVDQADLHPAALEEALRDWLSDPGARDEAASALRKWDVPDAAARILALVEASADPTSPKRH